MTTIITRLYAAEKQAIAAVSALKFKDDQVSLVAGHRDAEIETLLGKAGVWKSQFPEYAGKIRKGGAAVTVRAQWGTALAAIQSLDAHEPIDGAERLAGWNDPAPFSALIGFPVLEKFSAYVVLLHDAAPFSHLLKLPVLSNLKPWARLLDAPSPLSDLLRLPTISWAKPFSSLLPDDYPANVAAPLSNLLKLPVLLNLKPWAGLLDRAAPLSELLHIPTISRAKPFSSLIA
jgi:hypothetical protein